MEKYARMIPKIIHQIWSGKDGPLPEFMKVWGQTWIDFHPDWQYEFWDHDRMNSFIHEYFPEYVAVYEQFPYDIQRWDAIRYLILWKMGGMYVDFDYECLEPFDDILSGKKCCFSMEPESNGYPENKKTDYNFNNALMACTPGHPFMEQIIKEVFLPQKSIYPQSEKFFHVLSTTGPYLLIEIYKNYSCKEDIYLIPADLVSPFGIREIQMIMSGFKNAHFEERLQNAKAIHYFLGNWKK